MELRDRLAPLTDRLAGVETVQAITVVGSRTTGFSTPDSDVDLFVYVDGPSEDDGLLGERAVVADELGAPERFRRVGQPAHPNTDVWTLRDGGLLLDVTFWSRAWAEAELDWRLVARSPQVGGSTAFWRSIRDGVPLFERDDWHPRLQARSRTAYPAVLRERIIALNRDLLGPENPFSYLHQVASALTESDPVSAQRATSRWSASYFDVLFAINRVLHPGEKRLVAFAERECVALPDDLAADVDLIAHPHDGLPAHLERMLERLDGLSGP